MQERLTHELESSFNVPSVVLSAMLFSALLSVIVAIALITLQQVRVARLAARRRLRYKKGRALAKQPVRLEKIRDGYHLFLSHAWITGQDQERRRGVSTCAPT